MLKNRVLSFLLAILLFAFPGFAQETITGKVFHDLNKNGKPDQGEPGIPGIMVSNGRDIVRTDAEGRYEIQADDNSILFIIKPGGWTPHTDEYNISRFYKILSSDGAGGDDFPGLEPTGPWPESVDFALYKQKESENFRVVVFGDTQPRNLEEVNYIAHDAVQELIGVDAAFGVTLGDLVFDDLNLFDPLNQVVGQIGIPWIHVLGNHDIDFSAETNWDARGAYYRTYGPSWYAFSQSHVHFVVVDNIRWIVEEDNRYYRTGLGEDQMSFIRNFLEHIPEDELVVFLAHIPWVGSTSWKDEDEKTKFFELMASRPNTLSLAAHTHRHYHHFIDREEGWPNEQPHHMISIGTVCGAWWRGAPDEYGIPHAMMTDGTPTGYSFLEVQGDEWKLSWKAARRPADFQMHLHAPDEVSTDELARGVAIYANIFNALPDAVVHMSVGESSQPSKMAPVAEGDPVFIAMSEREEALEHITWRSTGTANANPRHLWKGTLPDHLEPGTYTLHIRSVDDWHVYKGQRIIRVTNP